MSFHGYRGMTMDVLQEKVDFLELLQFCVDGGPLLTDHYYFFLDLGFKLTATAGSDFPWCGNGPRFGVEGAKWKSRIGDARFYTYIQDDFSFDKWKENFKKVEIEIIRYEAIELSFYYSFDIRPQLQQSLKERLNPPSNRRGSHTTTKPLQYIGWLDPSKVIARVHEIYERMEEKFIKEKPELYMILTENKL